MRGLLLELPLCLISDSSRVGLFDDEKVLMLRGVVDNWVQAQGRTAQVNSSISLTRKSINGQDLPYSGECYESPK